MTESTRSRTFVGALALGAVLSTGCRMGLPPEPPGADATDATSAIPEYQPSADPFTRSAFAGETLKSEGGHKGHNMAKMPKPAAVVDTEEVQP